MSDLFEGLLREIVRNYVRKYRFPASVTTEIMDGCVLALKMLVPDGESSDFLSRFELVIPYVLDFALVGIYRANVESELGRKLYDYWLQRVRIDGAGEPLTPKAIEGICLAALQEHGVTVFSDMPSNTFRDQWVADARREVVNAGHPLTDGRNPARDGQYAMSYRRPKNE